jgi:hypothetical protein
MAHPWLTGNGFEDGTLGHFDAESDVGVRLDFPHYTDLARFPGMPMPYRGAYCARVNLATALDDAYLQETGSWDTSASGTIFFRFYLWFGGGPVMATTNEFAIFQLWSGVADVEATIAINYTTAAGYRIGVGETSASAFLPLVLNQWHCVELKAVIDSGVGNDGTLDLTVDGVAATQVATLNQAAITSGVLGVVGQDAGTTQGIVLFDDVIADDAQIYPNRIRHPYHRMSTFSEHLFVGPGTVSAAAIQTTGAADTATFYDTDIARTTDASNIVLPLNNAKFDAGGDGEWHFQRGCYVALSSNARASVLLSRGTDGPRYYTEGAQRLYGQRRR